MRILAIEQPVEGITDDRFTPEIMAAEALQAWRLHQAGVIRELYFHDEQDSAVLILECGSVAEAKTALASLPMVGGADRVRGPAAARLPRLRAAVRPYA